MGRVRALGVLVVDPLSDASATFPVHADFDLCIGQHVDPCTTGERDDDQITR